MIYYVLMMVAIVFTDQLTKWLAVICLKGEESFPLWKDVFHFTYVENMGSAFGILKDHRWVFMSISTVIIIAGLLIFFIYYKKLAPLLRWSISFLVAGGIGNMIDRIFIGYVVDFLDFTLIDFAVFNVADSFVCIGAGLFLLWYILDAVKEYNQRKSEKLVLADGNEEASAEAEEVKADNASEEVVSDIEDNAETSVASEEAQLSNEDAPSTEEKTDEHEAEEAVSASENENADGGKES